MLQERSERCPHEEEEEEEYQAPCCIADEVASHCPKTGEVSDRCPVYLLHGLVWTRDGCDSDQTSISGAAKCRWIDGLPQLVRLAIIQDCAAVRPSLDRHMSDGLKGLNQAKII